MAVGSAQRERAADRERGDATAQFVVLVPILVLLVLLVVQAALWYHTANIAQAGAARGAAAAAPATATAGSAISAATQTVLDNGGRFSSAPAVDIGDRTVTVVVELAVPAVVPFFPSTVTRVQLEPRERFIPEDQR
ncbi:MAG: TadE/TadG family type IV pilus assembly protein [Acidimicrobiia bacterium]